MVLKIFVIGLWPSNICSRIRALPQLRKKGECVLAVSDQSTTDELARTIDQLHGLMCLAHRQLLAVVSAYDRSEGWREDGATSTAAWLAYRLGVSQQTGRAWASVGAALEALPALGNAFCEGWLSFDQVAPLARVATAENDEELADEAQGWSAAQCAAFARRARRRSEDEADDTHRRRSLRWRWDLEGGMLHLRGRLPGEAGATVVAALERVAGGYKPDPLTGVFEPWEWRAADALEEVASAYLGTQANPERATVVIHTDADLLVGELEGGPVISAEALRRQLCDARLEVVAHAANGTPLGVGRARRNPPAWLVRQVRRRDGSCRFPGCERQRWGHCHHVRHWTDLGPTDLSNLLWLCPFHHRLVHEGGWSIRGDPAGEVLFVRPNGRPLTRGYPSVTARRRARDPAAPPYAP
ncbi:MAG: HNH endonuclease [Actinomycetota bacterium]|nr:HNH endonuclease [Actinomycetota bacterium]